GGAGVGGVPGGVFRGGEGGARPDGGAAGATAAPGAGAADAGRLSHRASAALKAREGVRAPTRPSIPPPPTRANSPPTHAPAPRHFDCDDCSGPSAPRPTPALCRAVAGATVRGTRGCSPTPGSGGRDCGTGCQPYVPPHHAATTVPAPLRTVTSASPQYSSPA